MIGNGKKDGKVEGIEQKKIINWVGCLFKLYWGKIKYKKFDERTISTSGVRRHSSNLLISIEKIFVYFH